VLGVATAIPALAGTVTQVINCGSSNSLSAQIADLSLNAMTVSTAAQESSGALTLTATETGCGGQGWNVTIQAASWTRQDGGATIPASALSLTQVANPAPVAGQGIDSTGGPKLVNELGTLDHSRKVLQANQGFGLGSYTQVLGVKLTIPAVTPSGAYQTIVTTTITAGP
jgi:hypothetical protein